MVKDIKQLMQEVVDYLGLDMIPLEFKDDIPDDSRLITKPHLELVINAKYKNNYVECAKSITHELRHLFQMVCASLMNDDRAIRWFFEGDFTTKGEKETIDEEPIIIDINEEDE